MSGVIKTHVQLGDSVTATQNFMLTAQAADGTMKLARGNNGATTQDVITVDGSGKIAFPQGFSTSLGAVVTGTDNATNISGIVGNYITALINAVGASNVSYVVVGASSGFASSTVTTIVTGTSCTVNLSLNTGTPYMLQTLTFPVSGTYLVTCTVTASNYSTNYRNSLVASAIRIG